MSPTRMFSMVWGVLEGFTSQCVEPAEDEEDQEKAEINEVSHGEGFCSAPSMFSRDLPTS